MGGEILEPLAEYRDVFRDRFKDIAENTFDRLSKEATVDMHANYETCQKLYSEQRSLASVDKKTKWLLRLRKLILLCIIVGLLYGVLKYLNHEFVYLYAVCGVEALLILFIILFVRKQLKRHKSIGIDLRESIDNLQATAWAQMKPLNNLFDWDIFTHMVEQAVPIIKFDPYFTTQRLEDLRKTYGWDDSFNKECSVLYSHSGLINGNPFVICRTKKQRWITKRYTGEKTINWTTSEKGSDGRYHTVHHTETLRAHYDAPFPEYFTDAKLIYANTAAPDLIFHRRQSELATKTKSLKYKLTRHELRNKAKDLKNSDFAMMTNEDFEVAFDTRDRNNNQQFALLFTALAQENILELLADQSIGFGDDFDFIKNKMINIVAPAHLQNVNLDMNPSQFCCFDYNFAKENFMSISTSCFRLMYFSLAPLLCIPMYQQIRPENEIYGRDMKARSSFWEHESLANYLGQDNFMDSRCVTECILKTEKQEEDDRTSIISVHAYGFRKEKRIANINVVGRDGRTHTVPVIWEEYLPVTGTRNMSIREDNNTIEGNPTYQTLNNHVNAFLNETHLDSYRRHIASLLS